MSRILRREWLAAEGWRNTKAGMWAWLIQRGTAVAALVVVVAHLANPFNPAVQAALLALVLLHALLGVRALLLDLGTPVRWHGALFVLALLFAGASFAVFWRWRWY